MRARPTRLNVSALTLAAWALFLGLLSGRPELVLVVVPLLLAVMSAALRRDGVAVVVTHDVTPRRLFEGERLTVTVTLAATSPLPMLEVLEPVPPTAELLAGRNHAVFRLEAGEQVRWTYELRCVERGAARLGCVSFLIVLAIIVPLSMFYFFRK